MQDEAVVEAGEPAGGRAPVTGDAVVDAALGELDRLDGVELSRHPALVDAVQAALAERLAETD